MTTRRRRATYFDAPIDDLLLRSQIVGADPADADADGAADDGAAAEVKGPAFWAALLPEAAKQKEEGLERSSRRRTQTAYGSDDDSDDDDEPVAAAAGCSGRVAARRMPTSMLS